MTTADPKKKPAAPLPAAFVGVDVQTMPIDVPWCPSNGYAPRHLETRLTMRQGIALRHIHRGMVEQGRRVRFPASAIAELLTMFADNLGLSPTGASPNEQKAPPAR
jgi:hypothetical protein